MAEKRMFAKTIVTSDAFLDMPPSARCLYFTLAMFADDDGFVNNPKSIMRQAGSSLDDMNILIAKKFIITFESGVIVIKHWRIHNYIRSDRKHETKYTDEMALLDVDEKGAYTQKDSSDILLDQCDAKELRKIAYNESELPYSFNYKIRQAFHGKQCPICGCIMSSEYLCKPTIQHNIPISKGGKHELGNISVICQSCNSSIRDKETGDLNANEVIEAWNEICQASDRQMSDKCHTEVRLGKDRLVEDRLDINIKDVRPTDEGRITPDDIKSVMAAWNELPVTQIQAVNRGTKRYTMLKARIAEYGLDAVLEAINLVSQSPFLLGRKTDFMITFDWFIRPNNFIKVYEGNYNEQFKNGKRDALDDFMKGDTDDKTGIW